MPLAEKPIVCQNFPCRNKSIVRVDGTPDFVVADDDDAELTAGLWSSTISSAGIHLAFTRFPLRRNKHTKSVSNISIQANTKKSATTTTEQQRALSGVGTSY